MTGKAFRKWAGVMSLTLLVTLLAGCGAKTGTDTETIGGNPPQAGKQESAELIGKNESGQKDSDTKQEDVTEESGQKDSDTKQDAATEERGQTGSETKPDTESAAVEKPEKTEESETKPETTDKTETKPETTDKTETKPEKTDKTETKPETTDKTETKPETTDKTETKPEKTDKTETKPEKADKTDKTETKPEKADKTDKTETKPEKTDKTDKTETKPEKTDKTETTKGGQVKMADIQPEITCPAEYSGRNSGATYNNAIKKTYYSTTCEKNRRVNIVLPVGYTEDKKYPVLYLLHGINCDENTMLWNSDTIQNMMTKGLAKEMIVVYPYMFASKTLDACTGFNEESVAAYDNFVNDLVTDLMPFIKQNYSILEGRENTAIAGFSMGGRETLAIALQRPDLFGYVCAIAPAPGLVPGRDWAMEHKGQFSEDQLVFNKEKPYVLMVCCGDKDGTVTTFPKSYHNIFTRNGVEHIWWEIPGSDHGDPAITSGIYNFCKYVFK